MLGEHSGVFDLLKNRICLLQLIHWVELSRVDGEEADRPRSFSGGRPNGRQPGRQRGSQEHEARQGPHQGR